jgi:hypothetical protein
LVGVLEHRGRGHLFGHTWVTSKALDFADQRIRGVGKQAVFLQALQQGVLLRLDFSLGLGFALGLGLLLGLLRGQFALLAGLFLGLVQRPAANATRLSAMLTAAATGSTGTVLRTVLAPLTTAVVIDAAIGASKISRSESSDIRGMSAKFVALLLIRPVVVPE